ncbi:MAG: hypothetical protein E7313_03375 [Clostridiales bacterium]|nr:hypothetical protein [Clostridiales bacterium]
MPAGDIELTANATIMKANFPYEVRYFYDGIEDESARETGNVAEFESQVISYTEKVKDGYIFDKAENLPLTISATSSENIIEIYYKLIDYTITYDLQEGTLEEGIINQTQYNLKTEDFTLKAPVKERYIFTGWTGGIVDENGEIIEEGSIKTPTKNVTITKGSMGNRKYIANWEERVYEVIIYHYLTETGPEYNIEPVKVAEDEILTTKLLGSPYLTDDLIPTYDENGNIVETDEREYLDGKEFYVVGNSGNTTGVYEENPIEVIYYYQYYPVVRIVESPASNLNGTEYITLAQAIAALEAEGQTVNSNTSKLQILRNVKNESVEINNKNIQLNLDSYTVNSNSETEPTIKLGNSNLTVIDESDVATGKISSVNYVALNIQKDSTFTLGIEEAPILQSPEIVGKTKGIEKQVEGETQGVFNFFDGKVIGDTAIEGKVDLTPVLYNATVVDTEQQTATLAVVSNIEARIGRKTYLLLEDAIADANTVYGADGSQVEIVVVKDLTKSQRVVVNKTKNIKLDLAGYTITTTAADYVFENQGKLEIVDSSATVEEPKGTGLITSTTYDTILNTYTPGEKIEEYTSNDLLSTSTYQFVEGDNGTIVSNNQGKKGTANSYIVIDLTDKTEEYVLNINAEVSSRKDYDYGYVTVTNNTSVPAYNTTTGRIVYISGEVEAKDYRKVLYGGNKYYVHLGYRKYAATASGTDEFKINKIGLHRKKDGELTVKNGTIKGEIAGSNNSYKNVIVNDGKLNYSSIIPEVQDSYILHKIGNYYFDIQGEKLVSTNTGVLRSSSTGYIELDLTNKIGITTVTINAEISCYSDDYGYISIVDDKRYLSRETGAGKIIDISGNKVATDYTVEVEGGKKYYLYMEYYKDYRNNSGSDTFTINSIKIDGKTITFVSDYIPYLVTNKSYVNLISGIGECNIENGYFSANQRLIYNKGNTYINGGTFENGQLYFENGENSNNKMIINDGILKVAIINNTTNNLILNNGFYSYNSTAAIQNNSSGQITVNDGIYYTAINSYSSNGKVIINGGIVYNVLNGGIRASSGAIEINNVCTYAKVTNSGSKKIIINNGEFYFGVTLDDSGGLIINDGKFETKDTSQYNAPIYNDSSATVDIYGGEFKSNTNTIVNNSKGIINIYGGTYESIDTVNCIVNNNLGTVNIGDKNDNEIKTDGPIITGYKAINNKYGVFNFYDGILKGINSKALYGSVSEIPDGVDIVISYEGENKNIEVATLGIPEKPVAKIGETTYTLLEDAINACSNSNEEQATTIQLINNAYVSRQLNILEGQNIKLDLNDNDIISYVKDETFVNNGKIEITDSTEVDIKINIEEKVDNEYGFIYKDGYLISNNSGAHNSTAKTCIPIDLTAYDDMKFILKVNAKISSEGGNDIGYATLRDSTNTTMPSYSDTEGRFIYISGNVAEKEYTVELMGGKSYNLYFGYRKDGSSNSNDDKFTITDISVVKKISGLYNFGEAIINNSEMNLGNIRISCYHQGLNTGNIRNVINNTGNMNINGTIIYGLAYTQPIYNSGNLDVIGGEIIGNGGDYCDGIYNYEDGIVNIYNFSITGCTSNSGKASIYLAGTSQIKIYNIYILGELCILSDSTHENSIEIYGGEFKSSSNTMRLNKGNAKIEEKDNSVITMLSNNSECIYTGNNSNLIINGGTITSNRYEAIDHNSKGELKILDGTILATSTDAIRNSTKGTIIVEGGKITSKKYAGILNAAGSGLLIVGNKDKNVHIDNPHISGVTYGVYNDATFNFYDGIIEGATDKSMFGKVAEVEDEYTIVKTNENNRQTAILEKLPIMENVSTGKKYYTLQSAIDDCGQNVETLKLLRSVSIVSTDPSMIISEDKDIVFDLNGYSIEAGNQNTIENSGKLEIISSAREEVLNGEVVEVEAAEEGAGTINSLSGNFIVNSGTFKLTSGNLVNKCSAPGGTYNATYNKLINNNGYFELDGGNITSVITTNNYNLVNLIYNYEQGKVKITNGNINVKSLYYAIHNIDTATIEISGGKFDIGSSYSSSTGMNLIRNESLGIAEDVNSEEVNVAVKINGGEFILTCIHSNILEHYSTERCVINDITITTSGRAIRNNSTGIIDIFDGTFNGGTDKNYSLINNDNTGTINIYDGMYSGIVNNYSKGTINISGGEFVNTEYSIYNYSSGIFNVENATVTGTTGTAIGNMNAAGQLYVNKSIINGANNGIHNMGKLTIGNKSEELITDNVETIFLIKGTNNGIYSEGEINYYNGLIQGGRIVIGTITDIRDGCQVIEEKVDSLINMYLGYTENVAEIDGTFYNTLNEAIEACGIEEKTIKLLKNIIVTQEDTIVIDENSNIHLDLNNNEIRCMVINGTIVNSGTLEIYDSSTENLGKLYGCGQQLIDNTGNLNLGSITLENIIGKNKKVINNSGQGNINIDSTSVISNCNTNAKYYGMYSTSTGTISLKNMNIILNGYKSSSGYSVYFSTSTAIHIDNTNSDIIGKLYIDGGTIEETKGETDAIYINGAETEIVGDVSIIAAYKYNELTDGLKSNNKVVMKNTRFNIDKNATIYMHKGGQLEISGENTIIKAPITLNASKMTLEDAVITHDLHRLMSIEYDCNIDIIGGTMEQTGKENVMEISGSSKINMMDGLISANEGIAIIMNSYNTPEFNFMAGEINSNTNTAVQVKGGTFTIGTKDYPVVQTPIINAGTYGVSNSGTFNFYDGKITGATKAITGTVSNTPNMYVAQYLEEGTVAVLGIEAVFEQVASIDGTYYDSLQAAINSAGTNNVTITLEKTIIIDSALQIAEGQNITLDLSAHSITIPSSDYAIVNNGTLTIVDTILVDNSSEAISKIENLNGSGIYNNGTLVLGVEDNTVYEYVPSIIGSVYGIENNSNLSVFDGRVYGIVDAVGGAVRTVSVPDGYTVETIEETLNEVVYKYLNLKS